MQIDFNHEDVRQLLVMLEVAAQVLGTVAAGDDGDPPAVRLRDTVFGLAGADASLDAIAARTEAVLADYDDEVFWAELIERLAERDVLEATGGEEALAALADSDRRSRLDEREAWYAEQFETAGLDRLQLR